MEKELLAKNLIGKKMERLTYAKAIDIEKKTVTAYVSTFGWDRMEERFSKGAWRLDNYRKNPVVLWAHDQYNGPIGKTLSLTEDESGLLADIQFDDQSEDAMRIFSLYVRGYLNAFSVGFIPFKLQIEQMDPEKKGIVWTDAELLEYSAVSVPANPGALVPREMEEVLVKTFGERFVKHMKNEAGEDVIQITDGKEEPKPELEDDVETSIKNLTDMCRMVKGQDIDENKIKLLQTAAATLTDCIMEKRGGVSRKEFTEIKEMVETLAKLIKENSIDPDDIVSKFMIQFDMATRGHRAK